MSLLVYVLAMVLTAQPKATPTPNLLTNGDLEARPSESGKPPGMHVGPVDSKTAAAGRFELVSDARSGKRALRVARTNTDRGYALTLHVPTFEAGEMPRRFVAVCWVKPLGKTGRDIAPSLHAQAFTPEWVGACRFLQETEPNPYDAGWGKHALLLELRPNTTLKHFRYLILVSEPGDGVVVDDLALYEVTSWPDQAVRDLMRGSEVAAPSSTGSAMQAVKGNCVENSSFELGLSRGWSVLGLLPHEQRGCIDSAVARHGGRSVRLDVVPGAKRTLTHKFRRLRVHQRHTLSAWVRASKPGAKVAIRFENGYVPSGGQPHRVQVYWTAKDTDWHRVVASGPTRPGPQNAYALRMIVWGDEQAAVWIDAVQLEEGEATQYAARHALEAALEPTDPTGMSSWDKPATYTVCVFNADKGPSTATLRLTTNDFWDRVVDTTTIGPRAFQPGLTRIERAWPAKARGSLRVRVGVGDRTEPDDEITLTIVPKPRYAERHPASRFGQHVRLEPWQLAVAKRLGACWVRMHDVGRCLNWDAVQPKPDQWVWADDKVAHAHQAGLEILGVLGRSPAWAIVNPDGSHPKRGGWLYPSDLDAWSRYVETVTRHYRGKVDVWEIWNEPWHAGFGIGDGAKYAKLSRRAYAAAKRGNPDCTIIGMCTHEAMVGFNRDAIAGGAIDACDVLSYHAYSSSGTDVYGRSKLLMAMLAPHRKGRAVWMTEGLGGYTYTWHSLLIDAVDDRYSRRPMAPKFTGDESAIAGAIGLANTLVAGAEKVFWYWSPWEGSGSIRPDRYTWFEYDGQLKPYAAAYAVSAHFLDGTRTVGRRKLGNSAVVCLFERAEDTVAAIWLEGDAGAKLDLTGLADTEREKLSVFDLMGNPVDVTGEPLKVSRCPVYLIARGCSADTVRKMITRQEASYDDSP